MPDFDELQHHANALNELLKERQFGIPAWALMVGGHWKAIAEMFEVSTKATPNLGESSVSDTTQKEHPTNVAEALAEEIERNRKLLELYKALPATAGTFGAMMIDADIKKAVQALASGDAIRIVAAYETIRNNE